MIDVGFVDRVRGGIGIHDMLKGGVIKREGFTGSGCPDQCLQVNLEGFTHWWECQWVPPWVEGLCHEY